jgi:hypothetical protein
MVYASPVFDNEARRPGSVRKRSSCINSCWMSVAVASYLLTVRIASQMQHSDSGAHHSHHCRWSERGVPHVIRVICKRFVPGVNDNW